jgi:hypothetical protein
MTLVFFLEAGARPLLERLSLGGAIMQASQVPEWQLFMVEGNPNTAMRAYSK